jgi:hypothetical protein
MDTYTVTDTFTGETATGTIEELALTLPTWYPDAPAEVRTAVEQLLHAMRQGDYLGDLTAYLGVRIS